MSFVTAAIIGGGVALAGGAFAADAARSAGNKQADAAGRATNAQLHMFDTINAQQAPYRQSGYNALGALNTGLGLPSNAYDASGAVAASAGAPTREQFTTTTPATGPTYQPWSGGYQSSGTMLSPGTPAGSNFDQAGFDAATKAFQAQAPATPQTGGTPVGGIDPGYFTHQFNASDLNANLAPNYQFQLDQGLGAVKNAGNLQSGLISGNTLKGINDYAQNFAGGAYQNAFNNYTANQSNIFNRLSNIAGLGQTATAQTGNAGTTLAGNAGNSIIAQGTAQAGGQVGQANAITGAANNAAGWYTLNQIMKNQGGNV